jgi:myo-inositol-1(or 4)-monophosphatase
MQGSANLNLMIKAARKAGRALVKDFREVENLQVSAKGPGDFVTKADREAERLIKEDLMEARPTYGWLGEETGAMSGADPTPVGWHDEFSTRPAALGGVDCAGT